MGAKGANRVYLRKPCDGTAECYERHKFHRTKPCKGSHEAFLIKDKAKRLFRDRIRMEQKRVRFKDPWDADTIDPL